MKVLVIGGGGREHALAWKLAQSPRVSEVLVAPGNAGTATEARCRNVAVAAEDVPGLLKLAQDEQVGFTVVGPEGPLAAGVVDTFTAAGLRVFGPTQAAAQIEASKAFTKDFLARHRIPTAQYRVFTEQQPALDYVAQRGYLIEPWGSLLVEGFRRNFDEVAAFRFTGRGQSYSALRGTPENVGVIGVAVFPEKARAPAPIRAPRRPYSYDQRRGDEPTARGKSEEGAGQRGSAPAPADAPRAEASRSARPSDGYRDLGPDDEAPRKRKGASGAGPSNIGTEYGESQYTSVVEVAFERRSPTHPAATLTLRYDDYSGLEARGIDLSSLGYAYRAEGEPEPFPHSRFAPPPR